MLEIISNNFNVKVDKEGVNPPPTTNEVISNTFTIGISKGVTNDIFESIQLVTDKDIKGGEYVRVAIKLKTKKDLDKAIINPKFTLPKDSVIQNVQWEKGTVVTDYRPSVTEISQKSAEVKVELDKITSTVSDITNDYVKQSEIKQLADEIELKVDVDGVISSINQTSEEIKIKANKINLEGAVTVTNETYEDRYIKIEKDNYSGFNEGVQKMSLGFKSPISNQSENTPSVAIGHKGVGLSSPYLAMVDYPATYNPIGLSMAYAELTYQFYNNRYSSMRFLGNGSTEINVQDYLSVGTYQSGATREELVHIKKQNGKGCIGVGSIETEYITSVGNVTDAIESKKSLLLMANDKSTGVVLYSTGTKSFEPMEGQGGQIYCGTSWSPWKGVYSNSTYSSNGLVISDVPSNLSDDSDVLDKITFVSTLDSKSELVMDVSNIQDTQYVEVYEENIFMNETEMLKLALLEIKKLKEEINILKEIRR